MSPKSRALQNHSLCRLRLICFLESRDVSPYIWCHAMNHTNLSFTDGEWRKILIPFAKCVLVFQVAVVVLVGIILALMQPPFYAPDEPWHWRTAWYRFEVLRSKNTTVCNKALGLPDLFEVESVKFDYSKSVPSGVLKKLESTSDFCMPEAIPPLQYGNVFSYPGVVLSRLTMHGEHSSVERSLRAFISSRLYQLSLTLIVVLRFGFLALQNMKLGYPWAFGTSTILVVASTPLFMQQASAISGDSANNALAILLASILMFWRTFSRFDLILLAVVGFIAVFTKPIVMPALFGVALFGFLRSWHWPKFAESRWRISCWREFYTARQVQSQAWVLMLILGFTAMYTGLNSSGTLSVSLGGTVDPVRQKAHLISSPFDAFAALWSGSVQYLGFKHFLGNLGWLDTPLLGDLYDTYRGMFRLALAGDLFFALFITRALGFAGIRDAAMRCLCSVGVALGALLSNALTAFALYLTWTTVGAPKVNGLQPRYFLFSFVLLVAALATLLTPFKQEKQPAVEHQNALAAAGRSSVLQVSGIVLIALLVILLVKITTEVTYSIAVRYW